jgi:5-methylcytosine-specific restriction endonuclease McrA
VKTEVAFLRDTAEKLKQRRYRDDLPLTEHVESIFCQVEFLIAADEIEGIKSPLLPKVRAPWKPPVISAERRLRQCVEGIIALPLAPRVIEPREVERKRETLTLKDLTSNNEAQDKPEKISVPSYAPSEIPKPERAPRLEKRETGLNSTLNLIRLVKSQHGCCAYCFRRFGGRVFSKRKIVTLRATMEHFIPKSMGGEIFFAACQMCNLLKSNYLFDDLAACRKYLAEMWERSGYRNTNGHFIADSQMFSKN